MGHKEAKNSLYCFIFSAKETQLALNLYQNDTARLLILQKCTAQNTAGTAKTQLAQPKHSWHSQNTAGTGGLD